WSYTMDSAHNEFVGGVDYTDSITVATVDGTQQQITVTMHGTDDATVNSVPAAQTVAEDMALTFSGSYGNAISVSDPDTANLSITLSVDHGTLTLSGLTGLGFTAGDGTADATMTFNGTQADINAALSGMTYTPAGDYNGPDTLHMLTSDGSASDADTVGIT